MLTSGHIQPSWLVAGSEPDGVEFSGKTSDVYIKSLHFLRERADRRGGRRTHVARDTHPPVEVAQHLSGGVTRAAALVARAEEQQLYRLAQRGLARLVVVVERGGLGTGSLPPHLWGKL